MPYIFCQYTCMINDLHILSIYCQWPTYFVNIWSMTYIFCQYMINGLHILSIYDQRPTYFVNIWSITYIFYLYIKYIIMSNALTFLSDSDKKPYVLWCCLIDVHFVHVLCRIFYKYFYIIKWLIIVYNY